MEVKKKLRMFLRNKNNLSNIRIDHSAGCANFKTTVMYPVATWFEFTFDTSYTDWEFSSEFRAG